MSDTEPILRIGDTYPDVLDIGDDVQLPIKIKNFTKGELEVFQQQWQMYVGPSRGTEELTEAQKAERSAKQLQFFEQLIRDNVTVDPGLFEYRGQMVTTGAQLLDAFHARQDILTPLLAKIHIRQLLPEFTRKNLNSPPASGPGSAAQTPSTARGDSPASTAPAADGKDSANDGDAADKSSESGIVH
jgi:hypothetical protein